MKEKLRMGMVGGGSGAFIGEVHRRAARLCGDIDLVAGVFGTNYEKSKQVGDSLFVQPNRIYPTYEDMIKGELALPENERIDFVTVCVPNVMHFPVANAFLKAGFNVLCEKPMTMSAAQAQELAQTLKDSGKLFALMHNYTGFPMVKQARKLIADGVLGKLCKINVEYSLGWLASPNAGKQAVWRVDPKQAGISGCMADIGTHAEQLIHYVTGLRITEISADLATFVDGRQLDDDGTVLLRFNNGARGVIFASEVSTGEENNFILKIYGTKAAIEWHEQTPEDLLVRSNDEPTRWYRRGWAGTCPEAQKVCNLPAGHPEGFLEAFTSIYRAFADDIYAVKAGQAPAHDYPGIQDGIDEMLFLEALVNNSNGTQKWTPLFS